MGFPARRADDLNPQWQALGAWMLPPQGGGGPPPPTAEGRSANPGWPDSNQSVRWKIGEGRDPSAGQSVQWMSGEGSVMGSPRAGREGKSNNVPFGKENEAHRLAQPVAAGHSIRRMRVQSTPQPPRTQGRVRTGRRVKASLRWAA